MTTGDVPASRIVIDNPAAGVRVVAFDRPEVRNAFDTTMYLQVTEALVEADRDETVSALIVTGTAVEGAGQGFMGLLTALTELSVPMLAAVNGVAVGLGFTVLAHCDLVLIDESARLRVPFAELGVPPEAASSVLFPARMGWQQAARILLTSDWVSAREAVDLGLALRVCAEGTTLDETITLATRIAAHPRAATRAITSLMRAGQHDLVHAANRREQAAFAGLLGQAASSGTLADFAARAPS
jgi:enoyl-CoA hydratase/carnithine racemase